MNTYFTATDFAWLDSVNRRGLNQDDPQQTTKQWVNLIKHPLRDEWAAEVPEDFLPRLGEIVSGDELAGNVQGPFNREQMEADGWFPKPEPFNP